VLFDMSLPGSLGYVSGMSRVSVGYVSGMLDPPKLLTRKGLAETPPPPSPLTPTRLPPSSKKNYTSISLFIYKNVYREGKSARHAPELDMD
jgi:hypothetical protein